MHVIFGGAFNGKKAYAEKLVADKQVVWIDAGRSFPARPETEIVVLSGFEHLEETQLTIWLEQIEKWDQQMDIIVIATEIGRGIVPIDPLQRKIRDDVGRFYQEIFKKADSVTRVWYGIPQTIKGEVLHENLHKNRG